MKRKKTITIFTRSSRLSQFLNDQPSYHHHPPAPTSRIGTRHEWYANVSPDPEMTLKMNTIIKTRYQILESKSTRIRTQDLANKPVYVVLLTDS